MREGERQVAPTLDGIRRDHVARYEWAAEVIDSGKTVIDFACGVGYGTRILAEKGNRVFGFDIDKEAITYASANYSHPSAEHYVADAADTGPESFGHIVAGLTPKADFAVSFETIEHIKDPRSFLNALREYAPKLICSVPNEDVMPYTGQAFHYRHYTRGQFESLLNECGWEVRHWYGQAGPESEVEPNNNGRTLIAVCVRGKTQKPNTDNCRAPAKARAVVPEHITILGLGPSVDEYTNIVKRLGGRHQYCDETWTINALGQVFACDLIFHMDDVRIQEIRAKERPESNIAAMLDWLKNPPAPVMTSRPHQDYQRMEPFPLIEVLDKFRNGYFNSTAAYAVAFAIWIGVKKISLFGCDYTYPNAHDAEKGRACVEFWLGIAVERGIAITVPKKTTLLDAIHSQRERFYGYDTLDLAISQNEHGRLNIEFTERAAADMPTATEVEDAYNHDAHPNALVRDET